MTSEGHKHRWKAGMHMDMCCSYRYSYSCTGCGAMASTLDERDPTYDPYSLVWMEDPCPRCEELIAGAKTRHAIKITRKDGTVEKDEETEHDQRQPEADTDA